MHVLLDFRQKHVRNVKNVTVTSGKRFFVCETMTLINSKLDLDHKNHTTMHVTATIPYHDEQQTGDYS